MDDSFELRTEVLKVDTGLGLVFGWAIVCNEDGEPYYDTQGDHIPEESMLEAATDFAKSARLAVHEHARDDAGNPVGSGEVVFLFPMTADVAKQFGVEVKKTGLMIGMAPDAAMLAKFKSGELTGFSIGGKRLVDEPVDEAA